MSWTRTITIMCMCFVLSAMAFSGALLEGHPGYGILAAAVIWSFLFGIDQLMDSKNTDAIIEVHSHITIPGMAPDIIIEELRDRSRRGTFDRNFPR